MAQLRSRNPVRAPGVRRVLLATLLVSGVLAVGGCSHGKPLFNRQGSGSGDEPAAAIPTRQEIYQRAQVERTRYLELEVERLRADLRQAEEAMVSIESGLRGVHTRADAVSALAEARISMERAARSVPWREKQVQEARSKLEEAERQFQEGHPGSAVFFASRSQRMADTLNEEGRQVARARNARFVGRQQVNLRAGPSTNDRVLAVLSESTPVFPERQVGTWLLVRTTGGQVGWIHASLLHSR